MSMTNPKPSVWAYNPPRTYTEAEFTEATERLRVTCVFGQRCRKHGFIHGAEAEELRQRFEHLANDPHGDEAIRARISQILDDVDARDSVAWGEAALAAVAPGQETQG